MSKPRTDWEAVEEIGRRLYALSLPGVPMDPEELAALGSALVLMANVETEKDEATDSATEKEKAEDALYDMIENTEDPCKQWELAVWLVSLLPAEVVRDLSGRRDEEEGDSK